MELCNFYSFVHIRGLITLQKSIQRLGDSLQVKGTILIAEEGINAAISSYSHDAIQTVLSHIEENLNISIAPLYTDLKKHDPHNNDLPFRKFKVRIRPEIVTLGIDDINPQCVTGEFVAPKDWNALITDPSTITIDTRNTYEYLIGHFQGAVNPETPTFRDFIDFASQLQNSSQEYKQIAMYCTGGIRCEKASSYLKNIGIDIIYQLHGGILAYFKDIPVSQQLWEGACFVFDDRIAINSDMSPSTLDSDGLPIELHNEKMRSRHAGHIYKKIMSITEG